jgi:phosphatidylglycerophosphate synthase
MIGVAPVAANPTRLWGLTAEERLRRIARAQQLELRPDGEVLANLDFVFDPAWLRVAASTPGFVLTREGVPVLAHVQTERAPLIDAMEQRISWHGPNATAWEQSNSLENAELRKKERPFVERLVPENVPAIERASYFGAYKGVTDLLTKYLWPEWALALTRIAARIGMTPNQVTAIGAALCLLATWLFYSGWYWSGLAAGLVFMVLDTVDGKLARCTITSSRLGDVLDHGIDLVHPPFWWWAWGAGLHAYGRPLEPQIFWWTLAVIVVGYVLQRLIEGAFIARFGMHIHVWRPFDSRFRLVTARRNPNMVILLAFLAAGRPDWGLVAVAAWTLISLLVHLVRLAQAASERARGREIISWLA